MYNKVKIHKRKLLEGVTEEIEEIKFPTIINRKKLKIRK
jgi:hypothetical protein